MSCYVDACDVVKQFVGSERENLAADIIDALLTRPALLHCLVALAEHAWIRAELAGDASDLPDDA